MVGRKPKLTDSDVRNLRILRSHGLTADALALRFGVARSTVLRYLRGECRQRRAA